MDALEGSAQLDGRAIAWRRLGSDGAPPLLLLNGYAATSADWDPGFLGHLAARFDVVCPDPRGCGGSELGSGELTIDSLAGDALAVLDALGLERVTVAGWSMGGFVAQQLAAGAPDRVVALALISTDPGGEAVPAEDAVWRRLTDHAGTPSEQARRLLELLFPPALAAELFEQVGGLVAEARARLDPAALSAQELAMERWHSAPAAGRLDSIRAPALVVAGNEDIVIPAANAELLAAALPGSRLAPFQGCGHAVMAQRPAEVAGLIAALPRE